MISYDICPSLSGHVILLAFKLKQVPVLIKLLMQKHKLLAHLYTNLFIYMLVYTLINVWRCRLKLGWSQYSLTMCKIIRALLGARCTLVVEELMIGREGHNKCVNVLRLSYLVKDINAG